MNATLAGASVAPGMKGVFGAEPGKMAGATVLAAGMKAVGATASGKADARADAFGGMLAMVTGVASGGVPTDGAGAVPGGAAVGGAGGAAGDARGGSAGTDTAGAVRGAAAGAMEVTAVGPAEALAGAAASPIQQLPQPSEAFGIANDPSTPLKGIPAAMAGTGATPVAFPVACATATPVAATVSAGPIIRVASPTPSGMGQTGLATGGGAASGALVVPTLPANGTPSARAGTVAAGAESVGASDGAGNAVSPTGRDVPHQPVVSAFGILPVAVERLPLAATPAFTVSAAPEPLHRQLAGPIATLATGPHGERTLTINVAPDGLGPVNVRAHLGAEGLRVELTAPTDAGRDALRHMLPDLKRDLAGLGAGTVGLSTTDKHDGGFAGGRPGDGQQTPGQSGQPGHRHGETGPQASRQTGTEPGDRDGTVPLEAAGTPGGRGSGASTDAGSSSVRTPGTAYDAGAGLGPGDDPLPGGQPGTNPSDALHRRFQSTAHLDVMA